MPGASDSAAPWRQAVREALARHGVVRASAGARDPADVAGYLGERAAARMLPAVPVTERRPWPGPSAIRAAAVLVDLAVLPRAGAHRRRRHPRVGGQRERLAGSGAPGRWLPRLVVVRACPRDPVAAVAGQGPLGAVEGDLEVVRADQLARLRQRQPAQRGVRALRPDRLRRARRHEVAQVSVLVRGSPFPGATSQITTWRSRASGQARRSGRPVSSRASRSAIASGSRSPGSPCPPTCSHRCCRWCQRSRTRPLSGCTISADAVRCSGVPATMGPARREQRPDPRDVGFLGLPGGLVAVKPVVCHPVYPVTGGRHGSGKTAAQPARGRVGDGLEPRWPGRTGDADGDE